MSDIYENVDVDTENTILVDLSNQTLGRKKIIINCSVEDFRNNPIEIIKENINGILSIHNENAERMKYLNDYFKGKQDILFKERANKDGTINNKHITNYAWEFVNFKKGYYVGKPIKYVDLNNETTDDIKYFNMYNNCVNKSSKDLIKFENMLITGIAHTMVIPSRVDYDTEKTSPYEYIVLDNNDVCVVRANDITKTKLFALCMSNVKKNDVKSFIYTIYYDNKVLQLDSDMNVIRDELYPIANPITEYQLNEQRMGVIEPVIIAFNSMNRLRSNQIDLVEEIVNDFLTFENVDVGDILEHIDEFRQKRMLAVNTTNPQTPAKIGSVSASSSSSSTNSTNTTYDNIEQRTYDIVGVPMPTSSTGQGVSGEAQVYGGGWENAQTIANVDTQYIMQFEREDLVKMLSISNDAINSKTNALKPYNIEIKFTINKSNNMLVKSQTFKYLRDLYVPFEQAFEISELTDDPYTMAKLSQENMELEKKKEILLEIEKERLSNELSSSNIDTTNEN